MAATAGAASGLPTPPPVPHVTSGGGGVVAAAAMTEEELEAIHACDIALKKRYSGILDLIKQFPELTPRGVLTSVRDVPTLQRVYNVLCHAYDLVPLSDSAARAICGDPSVNVGAGSACFPVPALACVSKEQRCDTRSVCATLKTTGILTLRCTKSHACKPVDLPISNAALSMLVPRPSFPDSANNGGDDDNLDGPDDDGILRNRFQTASSAFAINKMRKASKKRQGPSWRLSPVEVSVTSWPPSQSVAVDPQVRVERRNVQYLGDFHPRDASMFTFMVCSPMGTGKTVSLGNYIVDKLKENPNAIIHCWSVLIAYAANFQHNLNKRLATPRVVNGQEDPDHPWLDAEKRTPFRFERYNDKGQCLAPSECQLLIISVDSCMKLCADVGDLETLTVPTHMVVDESETVLKHFHGGTLGKTERRTREIRGKVFAIFTKCAREATTLVCLDAMLGVRTRALVKTVRTTALLVHNVFPALGGKTMRVAYSVDEFFQRLFAKLADGKNVFLACQSKEDIEAVNHALANTTEELLAKLHDKATRGVLVGSTPDEEKQRLCMDTATWTQYSLMAANTAAGVGVDCSEKHFDNTFVLSSGGGGATARMLLQLMLRVRHTVDPEIVVFCRCPCRSGIRPDADVAVQQMLNGAKLPREDGLFGFLEVVDEIEEAETKNNMLGHMLGLACLFGAKVERSLEPTVTASDLAPHMDVLRAHESLAEERYAGHNSTFPFRKALDLRGELPKDVRDDVCDPSTVLRMHVFAWSLCLDDPDATMTTNAPLLQAHALGYSVRVLLDSMGIESLFVEDTTVCLDDQDEIARMCVDLAKHTKLANINAYPPSATLPGDKFVKPLSKFLHAVIGVGIVDGALDRRAIAESMQLLMGMFVEQEPGAGGSGGGDRHAMPVPHELRGADIREMPWFAAVYARIVEACNSGRGSKRFRDFQSDHVRDLAPEPEVEVEGAGLKSDRIDKRHKAVEKHQQRINKLEEVKNRDHKAPTTPPLHPSHPESLSTHDFMYALPDAVVSGNGVESCWLVKAGQLPRQARLFRTTEYLRRKKAEWMAKSPEGLLWVRRHPSGDDLFIGGVREVAVQCIIVADGDTRTPPTLPRA